MHLRSTGQHKLSSRSFGEFGAGTFAAALAALSLAVLVRLLA